jgi:hypothetical protein
VNSLLRPPHGVEGVEEEDHAVEVAVEEEARERLDTGVLSRPKNLVKKVESTTKARGMNTKYLRRGLPHPNQSVAVEGFAQEVPRLSTMNFSWTRTL